MSSDYSHVDEDTFSLATRLRSDLSRRSSLPATFDDDYFLRLANSARSYTNHYLSQTSDNHHRVRDFAAALIRPISSRSRSTRLRSSVSLGSRIGSWLRSRSQSARSGRRSRGSSRRSWLGREERELLSTGAADQAMLSIAERGDYERLNRLNGHLQSLVESQSASSQPSPPGYSVYPSPPPSYDSGTGSYALHPTIDTSGSPRVRLSIRIPESSSSTSAVSSTAVTPTSTLASTPRRSYGSDTPGFFNTTSSSDGIITPDTPISFGGNTQSGSSARESAFDWARRRSNRFSWEGTTNGSREDIWPSESHHPSELPAIPVSIYELDGNESRGDSVKPSRTSTSSLRSANTSAEFTNPDITSSAPRTSLSDRISRLTDSINSASWAIPSSKMLRKHAQLSRSSVNTSSAIRSALISDASSKVNTGTLSKVHSLV